MNDITIITPTCNRPQQLSLVIQCINKQETTPIKWIVVDDGRQPLPNNFFADSVVPVQYIWHQKLFQKSTVHNSLIGLQRIQTDKISIIEDDDYYPPGYITQVNRSLQNKQNVFSADLTWKGYRRATGYYRVCNGIERSKYLEGLSFEWHSAAFAGKDIKRDFIHFFSVYMDKGLAPDSVALNLLKQDRYPILFRQNQTAFCVSLKDYGVGTPGWMGQHRSNGGMIADTDNYDVFKSWLGQDWIRYKKYLGRLK